MKDLKGHALGWMHRHNPVLTVEILRKLRMTKCGVRSTAAPVGTPLAGVLSPLAQKTPPTSVEGVSNFIHLLYTLLRNVTTCALVQV